MKVLFTLAIILFIARSSFAQLTPGSYVLGGSVGFGFIKTPNGTSERQTASFNITPGIGKFTSEKYFIEGGLGYSMYSRSLKTESSYSSKDIGHSFNARFGITRFFPIVDRLYFTLGGHISPSYSTNSNETESISGMTTNESSSISSRISISPGLSYFVNRKWMLYTYVGLFNYELIYNIDSDQIGHGLFLSAKSNSFGVGMRYIIGKGTNE